MDAENFRPRVEIGQVDEKNFIKAALTDEFGRQCRNIVNDIAALPPELIRKGRFDEIFFVDLPDLNTRAEILRIHAAKRGIALDPATQTALAQACEGFSGAEIEQAVVAALYTAHAQKTVPSARLLGAEIAATRPLETVMAEKVAALRTWAEGRTVAAE